jgi:hypothetical protein
VIPYPQYMSRHPKRIPLVEYDVIVTERIGWRDSENKSKGKVTYIDVAYENKRVIGFVTVDKEGNELEVVRR